MFSLFVFFISVAGQVFLEIIIRLADNRQSAIVYVEWYQWSRLIAFFDPITNPILAIVRTPALRQKTRNHINLIMQYMRIDMFNNNSRKQNGFCFTKKGKYTAVSRPTVSSQIELTPPPEINNFD
jgi:hypothetical protein